MVPVLAGRPVPEHPADKPRDRLHGWLHWTICVRGMRGSPAHAAPGVRARRVRPLSNYLYQPGSDGDQEPGTRVARQIRRAVGREAFSAVSNDRVEKGAYEK